MQITQKNLTPTNIELTITADEASLTRTKEVVINLLARDVNMAGFRKGKAPKGLVEKSLDPNTLQSRFLDQAVNDLYVAAITQQRLRPVEHPEVNVTKFVPFTTLEFTATVAVVGSVKLGDYKKLAVKRVVEATTEADIDKVLQNLRERVATKKEVTRAAKDGDEVTIDFVGTDAKSKAAIEGAAGNNYGLVLGSNSFIPGFEPELVGLKAGSTKTFDVTFPKDYGSKDLQNKKVSFAVTVKKVQEVALPKLDAAFAATVGPFKTLAELKRDIRLQLEAEKAQQADRAFENKMIEQLAAQTSIAIPSALVDEEIDRMEAEEKRNLVYRGQTWREHLKAEGLTEAAHREQKREQAELRVKSGLMLAEVAEKEAVNVSSAEVDQQIELLKKQYTDKQMQAELTKPENRRDIQSRMLTEKTLAVLASYAQAK